MVQDTAQDDLTKSDVVNNGNELRIKNPDTTYTVQPTELAPTHVYEIYAVHTNEQGVGTMHEIVNVKTTDTYSPVLSALQPAPMYEGAAFFGGDYYASGYSADEPLYMQFNEPVYYNSDYSITIETPFAGYSYTVPADSINAGSSVVTINHETLPYNGAFLFVQIDSAAFNDGKGNVHGGIESYYTASGGYLTGLYGWFFYTAPNPNLVLDNIFSNFSGDYLSESFQTSDSTTLMHEDTVSLTQSTEDGYIVTVNDFNGFEGASVDLEFKEQMGYKYLICKEQSINDTLYV